MKKIDTHKLPAREGVCQADHLGIPPSWHDDSRLPLTGFVERYPSLVFLIGSAITSPQRWLPPDPEGPALAPSDALPIHKILTTSHPYSGLSVVSSRLAVRARSETPFRKRHRLTVVASTQSHGATGSSGRLMLNVAPHVRCRGRQGVPANVCRLPTWDSSVISCASKARDSINRPRRTAIPSSGITQLTIGDSFPAKSVIQPFKEI